MHFIQVNSVSFMHIQKYRFIINKILQVNIKFVFDYINLIKVYNYYKYQIVIP